MPTPGGEKSYSKGVNLKKPGVLQTGPAEVGMDMRAGGTGNPSWDQPEKSAPRYPPNATVSKGRVCFQNPPLGGQELRLEPQSVWFYKP